MLTDNLGSTDVITDETGSVEHERQSYDSFGARRNVAWGKPMPPPSGPPEITAMGYTGHALDAEVGLVNAKGRLYDPKLGRFLQVDPLQTDLFNSQRWNSYSYALNNPLRYTDPTGFDGKDEAAAPDLPLISYGPVFEHHQIDPTHVTEWHCTADGYSECHGITVPVKPGGGDLGTAQAGSPSEEASAPAAPGVLEPIEASPGVRATAQGWGGLLVGLGLGLTPGGAVADPFLTAAGVMPRGTRHAEVGKALGEMLGGFFLTASGLAGEIVGTGLTTTGIGSVLGVPAIAVSTGLVTSGAANMAFGLRGFSDALMSSGSGSGASAAGGAPAITKGSQVTEQTIREAMKGAPLSSQQSGGVSLPIVQRYVDKLLAGEVAPAIKVDGRMIIDDNHRYIAGRILGREPAIQPWAGGRPGSAVPWETMPIDTKAWP